MHRMLDDCDKVKPYEIRIYRTGWSLWEALGLIILIVGLLCAIGALIGNCYLLFT